MLDLRRYISKKKYNHYAFCDQFCNQFRELRSEINND